MCFLISSTTFVWNILHSALVFHWRDFHEIRHLSIFRKFFDKVQVSLKIGQE